MFGGERRLSELLDRQSHRPREGLQERPTAGRAGLVDGDRVNHAVGDRQILHVLAANVDDGGDARAHHFGTTVVSHRLNHTLVEMETGRDQTLAIAGSAGTCDPGIARQFGLDAFDDLDRRSQRAAIVRRIRRPHDLAVIVDQGRLDRRGTGVDAQEVRATGSLERAHMHMLTVMTRIERVTVGRGVEQRRHRGRVRRQVLQILQCIDNVVERPCRVLVGMFDLAGLANGERRTVGDIQVRVGWGDELVHLAIECTAERLPQLAHEEQRASQEHNGAVNGTARSQAGNRLRGHGGEDRRGKIGLGSTVVDERLQVRLCEHTTARCDWVQRLVILRHLVETGGIGVEQRRHLVDERAGATRTRAVHALFGGRLQVRDLRVLATEFDDHIRLRDRLVDCARLRDHLLHERHMHGIGERQTARTGDG